MVLEILHEVNRRTRIKARNHRKLLIILACSLSIFFTVSAFVTGIAYHEPMYRDAPLIMGVPVYAIGVFNAVMFTSIAILFLKSLGEYSVPKITRGYWKTAYRFIFPEQFKKNVSTDIWDYVKLHRKHDPLYQADLEKQDKKIEELTKRLDEYEIMILPHVARQNRNSYDQNLRIKNLEESVKDIKQLLEKKSPENSISLQDLERITSRLLKVEEELRKLQGE